jgi:hypothetical protein
VSDPLDELIANTPPASADELDALIHATPAAAAPNGVVGGQRGIGGPVGGAETYVNDAVDMLPGGRPLVNSLSAGLVKLLTPSRARLGKAALDAGGKQSEAAPGLVDTYRNVRGAEAMREARGDADNPMAALAGKGTGLALSLLAPLPKFTAGAGAGPLGKLLATGGTALGYGALNALTNGRADLTKGEVGQALEDLKGTEGLAASKEDFKAGNYGRAALDFAGAGIPGALGTAGAISAVAPIAGKVGGAALRRLVKPTDDARALMDKGVPLTLGQMNPGGTMNRIENAGKHVAGAGTTIEAQREAAVNAWRQLAMKEGRAPGAPPPAPTHNLNEQLDGLYQGFEPAYGAVKGVPVTPLVAEPAIGPATAAGERATTATPLHESMRAAGSDPSVLADDATLSKVRRYLDNQSSVLVNQMDAGQPINAGTLMSMRSSIRDAVRKALKAQDYSTAELLRGAEGKVTSSLESQLPRRHGRLASADGCGLRETPDARGCHLPLRGRPSRLHPREARGGGEGGHGQPGRLRPRRWRGTPRARPARPERLRCTHPSHGRQHPRGWAPRHPHRRTHRGLPQQLRSRARRRHRSPHHLHGRRHRRGGGPRTRPVRRPQASRAAVHRTPGGRNPMKRHIPLLLLAGVLAGAITGTILDHRAEASRNSGGTYSLPTGNPVVTGTTITSTWANGTLTDIGTELTNSLDRQGRGP